MRSILISLILLTGCIARPQLAPQQQQWRSIDGDGYIAWADDARGFYVVLAPEEHIILEQARKDLCKGPCANEYGGVYYFIEELK